MRFLFSGPAWEGQVACVDTAHRRGPVAVSAGVGALVVRR